MNQSEFKSKYDPNLDKYVKKHIYSGEIHGEGLMDIFKSVGSKLFSKTTKDIAKKGANRVAVSAVTKTGDYLGNRAGDKIVQLLQKKQPMKQTMQQAEEYTIDKPLTDFEIAQRVNRLISGGKAMKM